jgi:TetR/AcrR family transcriptional regulator, transcriptional repressor for nem operon
MTTSNKKSEGVRIKILDSAQRLFNRHGFNAVSIDDVMGEAGLTRGSFYRYFSSKTDLYAQSVIRAVGEKRAAAAAARVGEHFGADQIVRDYLSERHQDDIDNGCPMIALPADVSRTDPSVRAAFESALRLMIDMFQEELGRGSAGHARNYAIAISALCVGGMVLARSVEDRSLAAELREASMSVALTLGNWQ